MALIRDSQHLIVPFRDIETATRNFSTIIGKGGYGQVYKGELLLSGKLTSVAVKRLPKNNLSGQGLKEFLTEIQLLSRYKHPNLVSLVGYCEEDDEKILIYEYAEHGSLDRYLRMAKTNFPLPWKQRIKICIDAARGLDYLHNHVAENHRIIHRDIKSANILIDHNWKAMIADLGLSKIGRVNEDESYLITNAGGTQGYCDPVYIDTGILTKESDVYSFGVVLFEIVCGRSCFMNVNDERRYLAPLARTHYKKGKLYDIIDDDLKIQMDLNSLNTVSEIAYQCLENDRKQRPSMGLVVEKLEKALELHELVGATGLQENNDDVLVNKSYLAELEGRVLKAEVGLRDKDKERDMLLQRIQHYEKHRSDYYHKMKSMEELWGKQFNSTESYLTDTRQILINSLNSDITAFNNHDNADVSVTLRNNLNERHNDVVENQITAGLTLISRLSKEFKQKSHVFEDDVNNYDNSDALVTVRNNLSERQNGVVASEITAGLILISRLAKEFEQRSQVFEDDVRFLVEVKSGQVEANLNPEQELRKLSKMFEGWKNDYEGKLRENKVILDKLRSLYPEKKDEQKRRR